MRGDDADVDEPGYAALDSQAVVGPSYQLECAPNLPTSLTSADSAREAYGSNISWPSNAPLNATWWHLVTQQMAVNPDLVSRWRTLQSKSSAITTNCTSSACQKAIPCYIRSSSNPIAKQNCQIGFGSTQHSAFA